MYEESVFEFNSSGELPHHLDSHHLNLVEMPGLSISRVEDIESRDVQELP